MIPPRVGLADENLRRWIRHSVNSYCPLPLRADMTRRPFSRMAPRKPDTQWVHFRCVQGQRSRTWGPHLSTPARVIIHAPRFTGPLRPVTRPYAGTAHRECVICSFAVLSPLPRFTGVHYFHAFRRFRPSVWLRVPFAPHAWFRRTLARLLLARDRRIASGDASRSRNRINIADPRRIPSPFFSAATIAPKGRSACDRKTENLGRAVPPG